MPNRQAFPLSRRALLASTLGVAALPLVPPPVFAAVPGDNRFVTILLRGGMDGLSLVQPHGDPDLTRLRPELCVSPEDGLIDLDGFFGLHPAAAGLMPLWQTRELAFVHATATPYRSAEPNHFQAQDMLESGSTENEALATGWLNRALSSIPRANARKAYDMDMAKGVVLAGPNDNMVTVTPRTLPLGADELQFLGHLYETDPQLRDALPQLSAAEAERVAQRDGLVREVAGRLRADARIAGFSLAGWDLHADQMQSFPRAVQDLAAVITGLRAELGQDHWKTTVVLAISEFGRAVRQNGSGGTEHGTAGVAVLAGGAIAGGRVLGQWPGLAPDALYQGRDLMATSDLREVAASMLHRQFDVSLAHLGTRVFPGLSIDSASPFLSV